MKIAAPAVRLAEVQPVPIADVRHVPLEQLAADADCGQMVRRFMRGQESPSRVYVAMFSSAI